jgi:hypothetical protein
VHDASRAACSAACGARLDRDLDETVLKRVLRSARSIHTMVTTTLSVPNIEAVGRDESPELPGMWRELLRRAKWTDGTIDDVEMIPGELGHPIPNPCRHNSRIPMEKCRSAFGSAAPIARREYWGTQRAGFSGPCVCAGRSRRGDGI